MGGEWNIVEGFSVDDAAREKLMVTENNLCEATSWNQRLAEKFLCDFGVLVRDAEILVTESD